MRASQSSTAVKARASARSLPAAHHPRGLDSPRCGASWARTGRGRGRAAAADHWWDERASPGACLPSAPLGS